jgi:hypothetical protein
MVKSLISATDHEMKQQNDLLSLPLTEITISSDGADLGNLCTLLSIIYLESRYVGFDPFLSEFRTVLVLPVSLAFPAVGDDDLPSSGMIAGKRWEE